ncbi:MAG: hypothetical protein ACQ9MH_15710 [Nitrospinales bacterium]
MNQTHEQIDIYSRLINPKPREEKPETGTRKDLEADHHEVPAGLDPPRHQNLLKQAEMAAEAA